VASPTRRPESPGRRAPSPAGSGGRAESGAPKAKVGFADFDKEPLKLILLLLLWKPDRSARADVAVPIRGFLSPNKELTFSEAPKVSSLEEDRALLRKDARDMVRVKEARQAKTIFDA